MEKDFSFDFEIDAFEKADAGEKARRIGGFVSTPDIDKQGEILLQEGLDFRPFLKGGWFNDNHSKNMTDVLGYPETAQLMKKGDMMPTGRAAEKTGWYVEGYILKGTPKADATWNLAQALQATNRRLGFSVEGKVTKRASLNKAIPVIVSALVKNVAITHCPVNDRTNLEVLAKALGMGAPTGTEVPAGVPLKGMGAGGVVVPESIEGYCAPGDKKKKKKKLRVTKSEALNMIQTRFPKITRIEARNILGRLQKQMPWHEATKAHRSNRA